MMNGRQEQGQVKRPMPGLPINPGGSMMSGSGDSFTAMEQAPPEDDVMELDMEEQEPAKDEETIKLDAGFVSADQHCGMCMHMTPDGTCQRYGFSVVDDDGCVEGFEPEGGEDILGGDGETEEPGEMEEVEEAEVEK